MNGLTAVSLFAGIGGIDRALERAGVHVVAAVEIDPACREVLRRHFPKVKLFEDVTEVTGDQLRAAGFVPGRGLVAAGWPCQGNSVAGRRGGMADPRSGLWRHVVRLLAETRPRWFLGENVPGLLSISGGRDFGTVLGDLDDLGFGVAWRILDAQWFGVPQRRRRVFVAGCLGDGTAPVEVLLEPESSEGDLAPRPQAGTRIAGTLAASAGSGGLGGVGQSASSVTSRLDETACSTIQGGGRRGYRIDAEGAAGGQLIAHTITSREGKGPDSDATSGDEAARRVYPLALRGRDGGGNAECGDPGDPAFGGRTPGGGSSYPMVCTLGGEGVGNALTSEGSDASEDGTGRGTPVIAFPTPVAVSENQRGEVLETPYSRQITTGGGKPGQGYPAVHPDSRVRRLTPLECERLQGLPDEWTRWLADGSEQSDAARYRQVGNSVAVPCVEWITRRIVAVDVARRNDITGEEGAA
jgi:DNA (cytosine-5)-methyltransferase 1